jgi:hypothetical protein
MSKPGATPCSQLRATTAVLVVNLQASHVGASFCPVIVMPTTAGTCATPSELRLDLKSQFSLSYCALTFGHVYNIHTSALVVNSLPAMRSYSAGFCIEQSQCWSLARAMEHWRASRFCRMGGQKAGAN